MKPLTVVPVTIPSSHKTSRIAAIVHNTDDTPFDLFRPSRPEAFRRVRIRTSQALTAFQFVPLSCGFASVETTSALNVPRSRQGLAGTPGSKFLTSPRSGRATTDVDAA